MENKENKEIRQIISYAPQYIGSLMRLLTQPSAFLASEFSKEKSTKEAMMFLCASFVVATARILYGEFESLSAMESVSFAFPRNFLSDSLQKTTSWL